MQIYYDVIDFTNIHYTTNACTDRLYEVISRYDNRFSHVQGEPTITIDGVYDLPFTWGNYYYNAYIDSYQTSITEEIHNLTIIITDNVFYILFIRRSSGNPDGALCWISQDGKNYIGASRVADNSVGVLETMGFRSVESPDDTYFRVKKHADFTLLGSSILFISASIISDDIGNFKVLDGMRSCSTVTFNTMVSINHRNYYAIGTNTLVLDA